MSVFDNIVNQNLRESIVDLPRDELDPSVFTFREDGYPIVREPIRVQILGDIDQIFKVIPVVNFFIVGSSLTKNYTKRTDIDVTVQIESQLVDSIATAELMHILKRINGRLAADTQHPINYYLITDEYDDDKADAIYDVLNDRWLKTPNRSDPDIEQWVARFQETMRDIDITTGEIRRDLIDIEEIKEMDLKSIKKFKRHLKRKLEHLNEMIKELSNAHRDAKVLRGLAFDRFMSPQEIQIFGSHNNLPENILYKLLEKYYYIKIIKKLEKILDEKDALDLSDASRVNRVMGDLWKTS